MSDQSRETAYQAALSEAYSDLEEICAQIAELRTRKEQIEKAATALKLLVGASEAPAAETRQPASSAYPVYEMPAAKPVPAPEPAEPVKPHAFVMREESKDPLQRHIDQALGMAALA